MSNLEAMDINSQYSESRRAMAQIRDDSFFSWDEREALFLGRTQDQGSENSKSNVNTQDLTNIIFDGASRVMAQFPTGKIFPVSKEQQGSAALMNLTFQKYVLPNANSQFDLLTKFRLWDVYSRVYGSMPALVDYVVSDEYIGPDFWLISPRHFFPQAGVHNIHDMQYCFIDNFVSLDWIESKLDVEGWKNIKKLIEGAKAGGTIEERGEDKTYIEDEYGVTNRESGKYARIRLTTRYELNTWTTFAPEFGDIVIREIPNPHNNGKLPIVMKECYPLLDRIYGLAEFERGKTLQYAANSLVNLYLDGVKFSIFPPTISTKNGVVKDSMSFKPAAHWQEIVPNSIRQLQISPQGINTFTSTMNFLKSGMLNMAATTDTSVNKDTDPGFGKSQRYSEPVLTPNGWVKMGDIKEGDYVINEQGKKVKVLEIHEQGVIDTYDVEFSDGSNTNCSLDHLWTVRSRRKHHKYEDITLGEIREKGLFQGNAPVYSVDLVKPVEFEKRELSIDPYLLGLLLGDGGFTEGANIISFTNSKSEIIESIKELLPEGSEIYSKNNGRDNEFRIKGTIVDLLKELGLHGKLANSKFILKDYLYSNVEDRERLFAGLMDTDGYRHPNNMSMEYCTVSKKFGYQVLELVRSLGMYAHMNVGISQHYGKVYGNKYRILVAVRRRKSIIAITKTEPENSRCLFVDTPSHLYVTKDYIVTHNTPEALKQQASREGARDSWDRFMMEQAIEEVFDRFVDMLSTKQEAPIPIQLFGREIADYKRQFPDQEIEVHDGTGFIEAEPDDLKGSYKYIMDAGTTMKKDENVENEALRDLIMLAVRVPGGLEQISQTGKINFGDKTFDFGEAMKRFVITSGVTDGDKIIRDATEDEQALSQQQLAAQQAGVPTMSAGVPGEGMQAPNMGSPGQPNVAPNGGVGPIPGSAGSQMFM